MASTMSEPAGSSMNAVPCWSSVTFATPLPRPSVTTIAAPRRDAARSQVVGPFTGQVGLDSAVWRAPFQDRRAAASGPAAGRGPHVVGDRLATLRLGVTSPIGADGVNPCVLADAAGFTVAPAPRAGDDEHPDTGRGGPPRTSAPGRSPPGSRGCADEPWLGREDPGQRLFRGRDRPTAGVGAGVGEPVACPHAEIGQGQHREEEQEP